MRLRPHDLHCRRRRRSDRVLPIADAGAKGARCDGCDCARADGRQAVEHHDCLGPRQDLLPRTGWRLPIRAGRHDVLHGTEAARQGLFRSNPARGNHRRRVRQSIVFTRVSRSIARRRKCAPLCIRLDIDCRPKALALGAMASMAARERRLVRDRRHTIVEFITKLIAGEAKPTNTRPTPMMPGTGR